MLQRGEVHHEALIENPITVSEVRMTPDLQQATAYFLPLAGDRTADVLEALKACAKYIRGRVGHHVSLRYAPIFRFEVDTTFDDAQRIETLLESANARRGTGSNNAPDDGLVAVEDSGPANEAHADEDVIPSTDQAPASKDRDGA
jgi:ribosome-binding factor A